MQEIPSHVCTEENEYEIVNTEKKDTGKFIEMTARNGTTPPINTSER